MDGLWLHGEMAEGGLWHFSSSSTFPSITLIRLHFSPLSVKKIHCVSDIQNLQSRMRLPHLLPRSTGTAAGPSQSNAPVLQQQRLCGVEAGRRCWGAAGRGSCRGKRSPRALPSSPVSAFHPSLFFNVEHLTVTRKLFFFFPRQWYLKALKAATFLCFGFVPFLLLLALCPALQMRCLFSPFSFPTCL